MYVCVCAINPSPLPSPSLPHRPTSSNELLEVPSSSSSKMAALANIVTKKKVVPVEKTSTSEKHTASSLALHDPDFVDDPDVPPLI